MCTCFCPAARAFLPGLQSRYQVYYIHRRKSRCRAEPGRPGPMTVAKSRILGVVPAGGAVGEGQGAVQADEGGDVALASRRELQRQHAEGARKLPPGPAGGQSRGT